MESRPRAARREKKGAPDAAAKKKEKDPLLVFAEKVRYHKELDSRWAVLEDARVEYFRGKDFAELLRRHGELATPVTARLPPDSLARAPPEELLGGALLRAGLALRCDRVSKTIRPGRKKLSKWPAKLQIHPEQAFTEDDGFFAWRFERSRPAWQAALSFLIPVLTVACCLFPVFPPWCKLGVLYLCLTFLGLIFGVLFLRWAVFGVVWIAAGRRLWFFPNILAEEATLSELLRFLPEPPGKDDPPPPKRTTRAAVAAFAVAVGYLAVHYAPDQKARARYRKKVGNIIDEVLLWSPAMLAGGAGGEPAAPGNTSAANWTEGNKTAGGAAGVEDEEEEEGGRESEPGDGFLDDLVLEDMEASPSSREENVEEGGAPQ